MTLIVFDETFIKFSKSWNETANRYHGLYDVVPVSGGKLGSTAMRISNVSAPAIVTTPLNSSLLQDGTYSAGYYRERDRQIETCQCLSSITLNCYI
jgi:hypothetical protein